jgi:hypothetical protein
MTGAQTPSVEMTVYGEGAANDANVVFPFDLALPAARDIWKMADAVAASSTDITDERDADTYWKGPHRDTSDGKVTTYQASASSVEAALRALADGIAKAWAAARGQQNRINKARYVEHEVQDDGALENFGEFFVGEDDYGPPPDDPPTPTGPSFDEPDGARMYGGFGP